jgi:hypothetical protein
MTAMLRVCAVDYRCSDHRGSLETAMRLLAKPRERWVVLRLTKIPMSSTSGQRES